MSKKDKKSKIKKRIAGIVLILIKPFIIPLLLVAIIMILVKNFFVSVWEFADEYLGLGMSADADWPVERTL